MGYKIRVRDPNQVERNQLYTQVHIKNVFHKIITTKAGMNLCIQYHILVNFIPVKLRNILQNHVNYIIVVVEVNRSVFWILKNFEIFAVSVILLWALLAFVSFSKDTSQIYFKYL